MAVIKAIIGAARCVFSLHSLAHPKTTFSSAMAGVVAITQSQSDWETLLGKSWGDRIFVLAKWFGSFCIAVAAAGRSVMTQIDNPPPPSVP